MPSASKARGRVPGKSGESARLIDGAATCSPSRSTSAPRPSAWSSPLRALSASSSSSVPTARGSITTGYSPGGSSTGSPGGARLGGRALGERRGSSAAGRDRHLRGVAGAPVRRDADHLHVGVGGAVERAAPGLSRRRARPPPRSTRRAPRAHAARRPRRPWRAPRRPAPGRAVAVSGSCPWWARAGCAGLEAGEGAGTGRCRGPRGALRARRRRRAAPRGRSEFVDARPTWPSASTANSTVTSSTAVAWVGRLRAKRSISERSRVTCASASAAGAAETAASASSSGVHLARRSAIPTSTSPEARRRRAVRDVHRLARARPCRSRAAPGASTPTPSRRASQPAQKSGVAPA